MEVLCQEDGGDPLCLCIHADHIHYQIILLFKALQIKVEDMEWAEKAHIGWEGFFAHLQMLHLLQPSGE